MKTLKEGEI